MEQQAPRRLVPGGPNGASAPRAAEEEAEAQGGEPPF